MHPIDFEGTNITLTKPESMTDEQCQPLKAWHGKDVEGNHGFITAWMPSKEDLDAINAGRPIYMKTIGTGFAPVSLFTFTEDGLPNY